MDRISLSADERTILGKKVKTLRKKGLLPGHVFGNKIETEHVTVDGKLFLKTFKEAGATGIINLKIGADKVRPVMIKDVQYNPLTEQFLNVDFYQVNLSEKVKVPVPLVLTGEEPETVKLGEAITLQTLDEVEVEALPDDLIEKIEVDISTLINIDDAITLGQLNIDKEKLTLLLDPETIIVKLAPAVSAEMEALLEEQAAETEAAAAEAVEGEEGEEGVVKTEGEEEEGEAAEGEIKEPVESESKDQEKS